MKLNNDEILSIKNFSKKIKINILDMALYAGSNSAHIGGAFSLSDIVACLYFSIMTLDKKNPQNINRDRFILSKGHACLVLYSALMEVGIINKSEIKTFEGNDSDLLGHPVINRQKGIEFSNGSLGMGLSVGIGVALAAKKNKKNYKVYVLIGDGECNEGSVWEAAMAAPNFKLNNIVAIIDRNNLQQTGTNKEIMSVGEIAEKWRSFAWDVIELDGHSIKELYDAFINQRNSIKPIAIIANTIKGKGFSFSENNNDWHHKVLSKSQYELAIKELNKK